MNATPAPLTLLVSDPGLRREVEGLHLEPTSLVFTEGRGPADLAILAAGQDTRTALAQAAELHASGLVREIALAGPVPTPEFLLQAMRQGVQEYLVLPLGREEFAAALSRVQARFPRAAALSQNMSPDQAALSASGQSGRILGLLGAKAGAGTTTLAVNLALAANALSPGRVVLVDLRRGSGEVPLFLDLDSAYTWAEAAENIHRLDDTFLASVLTRHASGLMVLPGPGAEVPARLAPGPEAEALARVLADLTRRFDLVVVDAGSGLDHTALTVLEKARDLVLVLPLSLPGLVRARRTLEALVLADPDLAARTRLAVNRHLPGADIEPEEAGEALGRPISWLLPEDSRAALAALNQGLPLAQAAAKSPLTKALARMARDLNPSAKSGAKGSAESEGAGRFSFFGLLRSRQTGNQATLAQGA